MEQALYLTSSFAPMTVAAVTTLRRPPDIDMLRHALDVLQRRHPLLRSRIVADRPPSFEVTDNVPAIAVRDIERTSARQWCDVVDDVLNRNVDTGTGPALEVSWLHDARNDEADLVFAFHHAIMDGASAARLYDQLFGLCSGSLEEADLAPLPLPRPIDELLPARVRGRRRLGAMSRFMRSQMGSEVAYQRAIGRRAFPIAEGGRCVPVMRTLTVDETNQLVSAARRRRLTVNSVVAAALVVATHRELFTDQNVPMRAIGFADLRSSLEPRPTADELGCYIAMMRHTVDVGRADDLWSIAANLQSKVRDSLAHDEHLLSAGVAKQLMTMILRLRRMRMSDTAVTYPGPLGVKAAYGDIEVTEMHGFITTNRLAPVSSALVHIFNGRLCWDFSFFDGDLDADQMQRIADRVRDELLVPAAAA